MTLNFIDIKINLYIFFYSWFHQHGYCRLHIRTPVFPFLLSSSFPFFSLSSRQSPPPPLENVTAAILSYAVSYLHEGTGKLRKTSADTVGHFTESPPVYSLRKSDLRSAFRYAGRGPAVTHPSTDPAPSCLIWVTVWCRTSTTHRKLSVTNLYIK